MIPQRVKLTGFLCYKDEQEIALRRVAACGCSPALNGSGKSTIFDAVTYALFGHHRGGSQNAGELINKESNALAVEFDFPRRPALPHPAHPAPRRPRRRQGHAATSSATDDATGKWDAGPGHAT